MVDHGIAGAWEFDDGRNEAVAFNIKFPNDMDRSIAPFIGMGWSSAATNVSLFARWQLEYVYNKAGEDTTDMAQGTLTVDSHPIAQSDGMIFFNFATLDLVDSDDLCVHCRLTRLSDDDDLGVSAHLHGVCMQYASDKRGTVIP